MDFTEDKVLQNPYSSQRLEYYNCSIVKLSIHGKVKIEVCKIYIPWKFVYIWYTGSNVKHCTISCVCVLVFLRCSLIRIQNYLKCVTTLVTLPVNRGSSRRRILSSVIIVHCSKQLNIQVHTHTYVLKNYHHGIENLDMLISI